MDTQKLGSGRMIEHRACVALAQKGKNVQFRLAAKQMLPTFNGQQCEWYVVEGDADGAVIDKEYRDLPLYQSMRGDCACLSPGSWKSLGVQGAIMLSLGQKPPAKFANCILVKEM